MALALQTIVAFDLICGGTLRTGPIGLALPEADCAPFTITYHVNVDERRWCADSCEAPEALASTFEGILFLRERYDADGSHVIMVDARNGRFADTLIEGSEATLRSGACSPAPFTGFPRESA